MSNRKKIKMLLIALVLPVLILCICGYYINKLEYENKVLRHSLIVGNIGLLQQKSNIEAKNDAIIRDFLNKVVVNPSDARIKGYSDQAIQVAKLSKELNDYIEQMKIDLVTFTEGCTTDQAKERVLNPFKVRKKCNYLKTTNWFGTNKGAGNEGKAHDLKMKLEKYRTDLLTYISTSNVSMKKTVQKNLGIINLETTEENSTWELFYFYKLPVSGALTELTKWQNNVRLSEGIVLDYLFDQTSATSYKFDAVMAAISPKSTQIASGSNFEADVFLAAYSTNINPIVIYGTDVDPITGEVRNGTQLATDKFNAGRGHISIPTSGSGERTCAGVIKIINPVTSEEVSYIFSTKYTVTPK